LFDVKTGARQLHGRLILPLDGQVIFR